MNTNLLIGAAFWVLLGLLIGMPLTNMLLGWVLHAFTSKLIISVVLGLVVFYFTLHHTPVGWRGVPLWFGKRTRLPWEDFGGMHEGWNSTILPVPFASVQDVDGRERPLHFDETITGITKDLAKVGIEALVQVQTVDPFEYLSSTEPEKSFEGISLRSIRAAVEDYKTVEPTVDHSGATLPALVSEDKMQLSRNVENEIVHDLPNNKTRWGMRLILVRVGEIHPPPDLMKALERKIIEPIERQAEKTQSQARREQTEEIIGLGVDPNIAYPGALVDAGKAGATVSGTTIRGFEKIGPALANLGDLGRGLTDALGGRAPKGPKK